MYDVLIVDDEEDIRKGVATLIPWDQEGFTICGAACNGSEGLEMLAVLRPHVVIVDIKMPVMDGLQMMEKARREHGIPYFILLTGFMEFHYAKRALELGAYGYLTKPLDEEELIRLLRKLHTELKEAENRILHQPALYSLSEDEYLAMLVQDSLPTAYESWREPHGPKRPW